MKQVDMLKNCFILEKSVFDFQYTNELVQYIFG